MKKPFLIAMALIVAPFAAQAETINLYGWQNHSWEFVDENGRDYDRMNSNAGNIGFAASVDTGLNGIHVNLQCEQFTFYNNFADAPVGTWCNRNSKIGLSHPQMGEIMLATWLLPYNEGVAQWVDPFYDAGADSHTSIMGAVGGDGKHAFDNPIFGRDLSFNRRQENIMQYWSPNWNGFVFRFAWTMGNNDESPAPVGDGEIDPLIRSASLAYTNGPFWGAVTWQDHEDWTAHNRGEMESSDAEGLRIAGRYIMDMGDGMSVQISAMWENLEYEFNGVTSVAAAMNAFGYANADFSATGNMADPTDMQIQSQKTYGLVAELFPACHDATDNDGSDQCPDQFDNLTFTDPTPDNPLTEDDDPTDGNLGTSMLDDEDANTDDVQNALATAIDALKTAADGEATPGDITHQYNTLFNAAKANAVAAQGAGGNVKIERDAWMVSGKIKFGGPVDFRFSYMDADDLEVSCGVCSGDWDETAADAWNVGIFYTMPAGTELRLTYSEVNNDDNGTYGQGISGTGLGTPGGEIEMFAVGIVHWFD